MYICNGLVLNLPPENKPWNVTCHYTTKLQKDTNMKNIDRINSYKTTIKKTKIGTITNLTAEIGVSASVENISFGEKTLIANNVYKENETYNLVYTIIDTDGNVESFVEDDGILPTLFLSPNQENYVSISPYDPDKDLEISIPVFNRENTELPKGNKQFVGDFIGVANQFSVFYDVDIWSDTKPDKMLAIEFKNNQIKKKHNVKVPLPRNNKIFIENNEIHLLTVNGNIWLHRQIDELGNVKQERKIKPNQEYFWQILSLSFTENSYILYEENGKITIEVILPDNKCKTIELSNIGDEFFNTWQPEKISENTFVTRFNGEFGNGWFTTKNDQLLEIFYSKGEKGYTNLLTNEVLELEYENLIISGINKTKENSYAVVFYLKTDRKDKNKELIILNREIK